MTLDRVLRAAVNSMVNGHHRPHCYSAWVKGEGYTNRGDSRETRADYLTQLERSVTSEVENMGYASEYAERGYTQPKRGILFANWNVFPRDFDRVLERMGYQAEWSDEWSTCYDCCKAVRTNPSGYGWEPSFVLDDSGLLCKDCVSAVEEEEEEEEEVQP